MLYGSLTSTPALFLVSDRHGPILIGQIPQDNHIELYSSADFPFLRGYTAIIEGRGNTVDELEYDSFNVELVADVIANYNVESFIILDDSYGYNAVSVAPYSVLTNSWVLFTDENNIGEIEDILDTVGAPTVLIYGIVDEEVTDGLARFTPEVINENGDRFANNIAIVKKYKEINDATQVILTNGEFIEKEIMSGGEPVVFIGRNNVPSTVTEYIQDSNINIGVLIGNELVGTATFVRRTLGISVFVKFAQGARRPTAGVSQVEALDMFYLPVYPLNLELDSIVYNQATNQLEITIVNTEVISAYFSGTYTLTGPDGTTQTVGDLTPNFIDGEEFKTVVYDLDPIPEGSLSADVFIIYGESPGALEKEIRDTFEVNRVRVLDRCEIDIAGIEYNKGRKFIQVETTNIGDVVCFVDLELIDLVIGGERQTLGYEGVAKLDIGQTRKLRISVELDDEDLFDNEFVKVRALYGERENSLVKILEGTFDLGVVSRDIMFISLLMIIIILVILIGYRRYRQSADNKHRKK